MTEPCTHLDSGDGRHGRLLMQEQDILNVAVFCPKAELQNV